MSIMQQELLFILWTSVARIHNSILNIIVTDPVKLKE